MVRRMTLRQKHIAEYQCWTNMKTRCFNRNYRDWPRYGGRGVTVCDRWRCSFENFLVDMGPRPSGGTLERCDNDGNYEPDNCVWATRKSQAENRRTNMRASVDGLTLLARDWISVLKVSPNAFYTRARRDGCEAAVRHYKEHGLNRRKAKGR